MTLFDLYNYLYYFKRMLSNVDFKPRLTIIVSFSIDMVLTFFLQDVY
jgi:hypothetical protein